MSSGVVGSLRVVLGLDSAQFQDGVKKVQSTVDRMAAQMRRIGTVVSAYGAGVALAVRGQIDAADELGKAAQKFGVPVEQLSTLEYAADLAGVSLETLGTSLGALSKNMAKSGQKFEKLGIQVRDSEGNLRATDEVLFDVADALAAMPDGAEKTALAMELLGKSGKDLIPLLNQGGAAIRSFQEEARAIGLEISPETAAAAETFNDNLSRLQATLTGFARTVAASLAPVLAELADWLVAAARAFQNLSPGLQQFLGIAAGVAVVLGPLLIGFSLMLPALSLLVAPLGLVAAGISSVAAPALLAIGALAALSKALTGMPLDEQIAAWKKFAADLKLIWDNLPLAAQIVFDGLVNYISPGLAAMGQAVRDGAQQAYDWFVEQMNAIWEYLSSLPAKWFQAGADMIGGLIDGFKSRIAEWKAAIFSANQETMQGFKEDWMIQSPSKVTEAYGRFISEGLAIGIQSGQPGVAAAMEGLTQTGVSQMETMAGKMQGLADGLAQGLTNIFGKIVSGAKVTLQDVGQIVSQIASTLFIQPFMSGLQSGLAGLFRGTFAGGFAEGGFIPPGQWGITGEAGPEIVSGGRSGVTVTPMGRAGGGVTQVFNITAPDPNAFRYSQRQIARRARAAFGGV
ncbi:MAG: phage tail tape measure protein [Tabrizicola sp.]